MKTMIMTMMIISTMIMKLMVMTMIIQHLQCSGSARVEPAAGRQVCGWWQQQVGLVVVVVVVVMMLTMTSIIAKMTIDHYDADNDNAGGKRQCRARTRLGVVKAAQMAV